MNAHDGSVVFVIARDPRGSLVHVRDARTGECIGCIEAGLFEVVRAIVADGVRSEKTAATGDRLSGGAG